MNGTNEVKDDANEEERLWPRCRGSEGGNMEEQTCAHGFNVTKESSGGNQIERGSGMQRVRKFRETLPGS
ncbi:hypothetical protein ACLOJK_030205 [Asimina triloba]